MPDTSRTSRTFRLRQTALALSLAAAFSAANAAGLPYPAGCHGALHQATPAPAATIEAEAFPPFLQIRTPVEPSIVPSRGRQFLIYELHLQNFGAAPQALRAIEVFDAAGDKPLVRITDAQLKEILMPVGQELEDSRKLGAGQAAVAFMCVAFDARQDLPRRLRHRIQLDGSSAGGPVVPVRHAPLPVFAPPVTGQDWAPLNGPHLGSHHRQGVLVAGGLAQLSRRYAIDWRPVRNGAYLAGDPLDLRAYYAYAQDVFAVADGAVVQARDGMPDNVPRTPAGFTPAVPVTMESVAGNTVVVKLANGQFASYSHLQPGSVRVKTGDRVKRGQQIARIGNSGDSRWPHLHFQVTSTPHILDSEGLPFVIDRYRVRTAGGWETLNMEFPWGDDLAIDFSK